MSKKTVYENYRVTVTPEDVWVGLHIDAASAHHASVRNLEALVKEVDRHVDNDGVHAEWDTSVVCEYCGYEWEGDDVEPGCCEKAIVEWKALQETLPTNNGQELATSPDVQDVKPDSEEQ